MAKSMRKIQCENVCTSNESKCSFSSFFMRKIGSFYAELFLTVCIALPIHLVACKYFNEYIGVAFHAFANDLLLLRMSGITNPNCGVCLPDWYLSSMLIAICVFYPIIRRKPNTALVTAIAILSLSTLRYLYLKTPADSTDMIKMPFIIPNENFRAIGMMGFGIIVYNLGMKCKGLPYSPTFLHFVRIIKFASILACAIYALTSIQVNELLICILFGIYLIAIPVLSNAPSNKARPSSHNICNLLGKLSLTIFLVHLPAIEATRSILERYNLYDNQNYRLILSAVITAIFVLIVTSLKHPLINKYRDIKQRLAISHT